MNKGEKHLCKLKINDLDENDKIMLWDLKEDIGYVDEIDNEIIKCIQN